MLKDEIAIIEILEDALWIEKRFKEWNFKTPCFDQVDSEEYYGRLSNTYIML